MKLTQQVVEEKTKAAIDVAMSYLVASVIDTVLNDVCYELEQEGYDLEDAEVITNTVMNMVNNEMNKGNTTMKLTTTFVEEQTEAAIDAVVGTLHETVIDSVYALMEMKGIDVHNLSQDDEELIDRTVIEMVDNLL